MIEILTSRFKGTLIKLLGKTEEEAVKGLTSPDVFQSPRNRILIWKEVGCDGAGHLHHVNFMAVVRYGRVAAVALHSPKHIARLLPGADGPFFASEVSDQDWDINLVTKTATGYRNIGPLQGMWQNFRRVS